MRFLKSTTPVRFCLSLLILFFFKIGYSQINSPYSRYGLGDLYTSRNAMSKAMGNLATPIYDYQSVNYTNPATYSRLQAVTFEVGAEFETRVLRSKSQPDNFRSNDLRFNYLALGVPLKKGPDGLTRWGLAFGLRPITGMNYSITERSRLSGIDSIATVYRGTGGTSKAYLGTGYRIGGFSIGANFGILFGQYNVSTQRLFLNDTVQYWSSNRENKVSYNKFTVDAGAQWDIKLSSKTILRLAATGYFGGTVPTTTSTLTETIYYNGTGSFDSVDVVERQKDIKGTITMPSGYSGGIAFEKKGSWLIGGEYERMNWDDYRFNDKNDQVGTTSMYRFGGQWTPTADAKKYINRITYRGGFYTGQDYIKVDNKQLPVWAATFGFCFPVRRWNTYSNQFTVINTAFEFGKRGNSNFPVTEGFFRLNVALCLSDLWFNKRKYD